MTPVARRLVTLFVIVGGAAGALALLLNWSRRKRDEETCVVKAFHQVTDPAEVQRWQAILPPEYRARALEAIRTGTLNLAGTGIEEQNLRLRTKDGSLVKTLAECRASLGERELEPIKLTGVTRVSAESYRDRWRAPAAMRGIEMSSTNPKVGRCTTEADGSCWIPFTALDADERVDLTPSKSGLQAFGSDPREGASSSFEAGALQFIAHGAGFRD